MGLSISTATEQGAPTLRRTLRMKDLVAYGLVYIAPMAPLTTFGFVWDASGELIALAYLLGALCMYFTAQSYVAMSAKVPSSGSVYGFTRHSLGEVPGFIAGWLILLDYLLISALVFLVMSIGLQTLLPNLDRTLSILGLVALCLAVNWAGIAVTTRMSLVSAAIQFVVMIVLIILALYALSDGKGASALTAAPFYDASQFDPMKIFAATSICVLSFLGFDAITTLCEEAKSDDRRMIGRAIFIVLGICTLVFVGGTWVLGNLMPGITIDDPSSAIYQLLTVQISPFSTLAVAWIIALLTGFTNVLPMQVGVSRVLCAMSRDRQLPGILTRLNPKNGTPQVALLFSTLISLAVAIAIRNDIDTLATFVNFVALSAFALLHVSVLVQFAIKERSRLFAHWIVPIVGIVVVLVILQSMNRSVLELGAVWLLIGFVYGLFLRQKGRAALEV
ncbi:amino acid permease [Pseudomonas sp. PA15(2017)]|uniref:APC family permease n=1 Tax=Pseudomonas sp. PA15(2017) TaxID=1932111 RepID=UPI000969ECCA|nr:APC family permease [Pseudomonas sp. PA15(2017)]OLU28680.1 amino acid permease [Pseudomonas sp. PA15(2017)]